MGNLLTHGQTSGLTNRNRILRHAEPHNPLKSAEKAGKRREGHTDGKAIPERRSDGKRCYNRDRRRLPAGRESIPTLSKCVSE